MNITRVKNVIQLSVSFRLRTNLLLRSGEEGTFSDSTVDRTADGRLHINGYVWASLIRRALSRLAGAEELAERIGCYKRHESTGTMENRGVSPLWCETTLSDFSGGDIRTGSRIHRKWGSTDASALYSDEMEVPGSLLTLNLNFFCEEQDEPNTIRKQLLGALWVINEGIENIGGGWSYGHGRLEVEAVRLNILKLENLDHRTRLWDYSNLPELMKSQWNMEPKIIRKRGWTKFNVKGTIKPGQLLAIHSAQPDYDQYKDYTHLPDTFVFRPLHRIDDRITQAPVVTGKAFRQAVISSSIERQLRTEGYDICETPGEGCTCMKCIEYRKGFAKRNKNSPDCECIHCSWFGSTHQGGIIAVLDATVNDPRTEVLHRIQICEHSFQNINLFSGEYLTGGDFDLEILIDKGIGMKNSGVDKLINKVAQIIFEISEEDSPDCNFVEQTAVKAPPGWYRLGATTTCTGQFTITKWSCDNV